MNRIDRIIRESIDRFILRESDWDRFERPTKTRITKKSGEVVDLNGDPKNKNKIRKELGLQPKEHKKRVVAKTIFDANPMNASQIRRTLRKSWESTLYPMYHLLSKFIKQYGEYNANWLLRQFGETDEYGKLTGNGLDTIYNSLYDKINEYTSNIEGYGSDLRHIKSRCGEIATLLSDIQKTINEMCESCKKLRKSIRGGIKDPKVNPRIISGYVTSGGLKQKAIYNDKSSETMRNLNDYITRLIGCLNYISTYDPGIDMSGDINGVKTMRR